MVTINIKKYNSLASILVFCAVMFCMASCKKSPDAFDDLKKTLQIATGGEYSYHTSYAIGDTIIIQGRFTTDTTKLELTIGGKKAKLVYAAKLPVGVGYNSPNSNLTIDDNLFILKAIITSNIPIGKNLPVIIISDGKSIQGPPVEITNFANLQAFTKPLTFAAYFTPPQDTAFFMNMVNGKGSFYYFSHSEGFQSVHEGNVKKSIPVKFSDNGLNFSIIQILAGTVDPQEKFMYAYAQTTDRQSVTDTAVVLRLLKVDLSTNVLTILNRSLYGFNQNDFTLHQGNVNMIKLGRGMADMWADQSENLYFINLAQQNNGNSVASGGSGVFQLNSQGYASVLFDTHNQTQLNLTLSNIVGLSADGTTLYLNSSIFNTKQSQLLVFDIQARTFVYQLNPGASLGAGGGDGDLKNTGPFQSLQFSLPKGVPIIDYNPPGGLFMPMPTNRLLYFYASANSPVATYRLPDALITLDFDSKQAFKYAPDSLATAGYSGSKGSYLYGDDPYGNAGFYSSFYDTGKMLNYDESGNIYMLLGNPAPQPYGDPGKLVVVRTMIKK